MANRLTFFVALSIYFVANGFEWHVVTGVPLQKDEGDGESLRTWRSTMIRDRESLPDYQPLCQSVNHRVDLHEPGFEFRPPFYHAVECKHTASKHHKHHSHKHHASSGHEDICLQSGLSCVQRTRTIQIAKRRIGSTCWTLSTTKEVPSGCECMWPVESHGDSRYHT